MGLFRQTLLLWQNPPRSHAQIGGVGIMGQDMERGQGSLGGRMIKKEKELEITRKDITDTEELADILEVGTICVFDAFRIQDIIHKLGYTKSSFPIEKLKKFIGKRKEKFKSVSDTKTFEHGAIAWGRYREDIEILKKIQEFEEKLAKEER